MLTYEPHDQFLNTDTGEIDTFYEHTTFLTDYETYSKFTDDEIDQKESDLSEYFADMESCGVLIQVFPIHDENGALVHGYQTVDGQQMREVSTDKWEII